MMSELHVVYLSSPCSGVTVLKYMEIARNHANDVQICNAESTVRTNRDLRHERSLLENV